MRILILAFMTLATMATSQAITHSVTLGWTASTTPGVTYNVKRGATAGGTKTVLVSGLSVLTFTDAGLVGGFSGCYTVSASAAGFLESDDSNEVCATIPPDPVKAQKPGTLVIQKQL